MRNVSIKLIFLQIKVKSMDFIFFVFVVFQLISVAKVFHLFERLQLEVIRKMIEKPKMRKIKSRIEKFLDIIKYHLNEHSDRAIFLILHNYLLEY